MKRPHAMRSFLSLFIAVGIGMVRTTTAQTANEENEGSTLTYDSQMGAYDFSW